MVRHGMATIFCVECMRYIDSIIFIVIATDPATRLNNGTGSQVTTVNNTVFIQCWRTVYSKSRSKYVQQNVFEFEY